MHEALTKINYDTYENILKIKPIFISRMPRRKVKAVVNDETIRGIKKIENEYRSVIKTPLTKLKLTKDKKAIDGYPEKQIRDDLYLYKGLYERLLQFNGDAKEAFKDPFYKPNKDGSKGQLVKKVKIEKTTNSFVYLNNGKGIADNGSMIRIDIFLVENEGYYFVPIYAADVIKEKLPNKACVQSKPMSDWKEMKEEDFIFSLYPNDLVKIISKNGIKMNPIENKELKPKVEKEMYAYYIKSGIGSACIKIVNHDSAYAQEGIGIKSLIEIKKCQVDVLGNISEVKIPEKRLDFSIMKGGKA
jgi:CRISPR-associated endonuclease Csn1